MADKNFEYEIVKHIADLNENKYQTLELNYIKYGLAPKPKYDIRKWDKTNNNQMGKGITLTRDEAKNLCEALSKELKETTDD